MIKKIAVKIIEPTAGCIIFSFKLIQSRGQRVIGDWHKQPVVHTILHGTLPLVNSIAMTMTQQYYDTKGPMESIISFNEHAQHVTASPCHWTPHTFSIIKLCDNVDSAHWDPDKPPLPVDGLFYTTGLTSIPFISRLISDYRVDKCKPEIW